MLEQYPFLAGLLVSRIVGGVTTNLLSSVFETWLDTEFHNRCRAAKPGVDAFARSSDDTTTVSESTNEWNVVEDDEDDIAKNEYELIMRDSVIISNLASIASGYLAHMLAERYGAVGPFRGAVSCTAIAFVVISLLWKENYGGPSTLSCADKQTEDTLLGLETDIDNEGHSPNNQGQNSSSSSKSIRAYIMKGFSTLRADPKILYLGVIQGLSAGSLQLFIFLWSPTLQNFAPGQEATFTTNNLSLFGLFRWAVDRNGEPNYGLIFGAFMAAGVAGGFCAPYIRHAVALLFLQSDESSLLQTVHVGTKRVSVRPMELEFLLGVNYISAAVLMLVPSILQKSSPESFSISLAAFLFYEFLVGVSMTYEGVVRSLHLPSNARATMMMVPRMIVNLAVSLGVLLTKYIATQSAFVVVALLMTCSGILQLSFVSSQEWNTIRRKSSHRARSLSSSAAKLVWSSAFKPKDD
ncbi:unnamed protein product [Pseudo-nitzschia multistriata]|uniref:Molybdate-anion transporter n=1 Tax=Pseudo-nitzschia multistriata TaxID=183589 RepID=A0A448YX73_9STRA|nr:unnamed protein product [Pseudo-nitzschia multistriata]